MLVVDKKTENGCFYKIRNECFDIKALGNTRSENESKKTNFRSGVNTARLTEKKKTETIRSASKISIAFITESHYHQFCAEASKL